MWIVVFMVFVMFGSFIFMGVFLDWQSKRGERVWPYNNYRRPVEDDEFDVTYCQRCGGRLTVCGDTDKVAFNPRTGEPLWGDDAFSLKCFNCYVSGLTAVSKLPGFIPYYKEKKKKRYEEVVPFDDRDLPDDIDPMWAYYQDMSAIDPPTLAEGE